MTASVSPASIAMDGSGTTARTDPVRSPALLSARGLVKNFGKSVAVAGVDFDIPERAFTTLLGPSGCGKTTILRMIAGFEDPTGGSLELDGQSLASVPPEKRPVNTVFQSYALFPHMTVAENVGFSLTLQRQTKDVVERRVQRALDTVHMVEFAARYPSELSGGQQQRVAVARAIVAEPRLLLLDEPLSALDRKMREHLQIELKDLQRRLGIAFVYVTHDQEEAFALSDLIIVMNRGVIAQKGPPDEIYARPANAFVADFIGGASLVSGRVAEKKAGSASIATPLGVIEAEANPAVSVGGEAVLVIRPEHVAFVGEGERADAEATVIHAIYQGGRTLLEAEAAGVRLKAWSTERIAPGAQLRLALDWRRIFVTEV